MKERLSREEASCGVAEIFFISKIYGAAKTDLDRLIWFSGIHDHRLGRLHIHELILDLYPAVSRKILDLFSLRIRGVRPRHRRKVATDSGDIATCSFTRVSCSLVSSCSRTNSETSTIGAVLVAARVFRRNLTILKRCAADSVSDFQKLRRLALIDCIDREMSATQR